MINRRGFTLVELVVVIAVIAILATLATIGLNRYLEDGRDTRRSANVSTISEALEKYYDKNGEYPSCAAITGAGSTVAGTVLPGIDESALVVPDAGSSTTNSIRCGTTLATNGEDFIEYVGDGSPDCAASGSCLSYTLRYRQESDSTIAEVNSRRTADFATSGSIRNLAATVNGFNGANLTWSAIQNSNQYTVQRATDDAFTANLVSTPTTNTSLAVSGLTAGTDYFFRVMPTSGGQSGVWSNTATTTTLELGDLTISATVNSTTQITTNWNVPSNANGTTTYTLQRATNSTFTTGLATFPGLTTTSHVSTGLSVGQSYYFRVQAFATGDTSDMSNTAASTTIPNAPTGVTATVNSATQYTISWTAAGGATSYIVRYGTSTAANTYSATTTGTSIAISSNILQGTTHYFKVYSAASGVESSASATVSGTTPINTPGTYNMSGSNNGSAAFGSSPVSCPSGTTPDYYWNANGGFWVQGTQHQSVGYSLAPGQGVTIQVATRCIKGGVVSDWRWSNNSYGYTRPGMNLSMWLGADGCWGGFCGRQVNAAWNNMCGTGAPRIYAHQYSAYTNWVADSATNDLIAWKGASGAGVWVYYDSINIGCTSASGAIQVPSAYKCNGCS